MFDLEIIRDKRGIVSAVGPRKLCLCLCQHDVDLLRKADATAVVSTLHGAVQRAIEIQGSGFWAPVVPRPSGLVPFCLLFSCHLATVGFYHTRNLPFRYIKFGLILCFYCLFLRNIFFHAVCEMCRSMNKKH